MMFGTFVNPLKFDPKLKTFKPDCEPHGARITF